MKTYTGSLTVALLLTIGTLLGVNQSSKASTSESLFVNRITLIDNSTALVEVGHLLNNGEFEVVSSQVTTIAFWVYPQIVPINRKLVVTLEDFLMVKNYGWIPNWVRSDKVYWVGLDQVVIVGIKGICDPNSDVNLAFINLTPYPFIVLNWDNRPSNIFDDQDVKVSWHVVNIGGTDVGTTFSFAVFIDGEFAGEAHLDRLAAMKLDEGLMLNAVNVGKLQANFHKVKVVIDWKNEISEWNENDNSYTMSFIVLPGRPTITTKIDQSGPTPQLIMSFVSYAGNQYVVESSDAVPAPASVWTEVQTIVGDDSVKTFTNAVIGNAKFFRIRRK